ncbi:MAG: 50S ribosomal protein L29 [Pseudomonadales bacterium]
MKTSELKEKSVEELQQELVTLAKEQFKHRMDQSTGQLTRTHMLKATKKDIARVKTVLNEKMKAS